jgi:hypothetical protein
MVSTGNIGFFAARDATDALLRFSEFNFIAFAIRCHYCTLQVALRLHVVR